jgi:thymidylate kinase
MERLETQQKVQEIYMKFVDNGKLVSIDGDKPKSSVEKTILCFILEFLQTKT